MDDLDAALFEAIEAGWEPEVVMSSGYNDKQGASFMKVSDAPAGMRFNIRPMVDDGAEAKAEIIPDDGSEKEVIILRDNVPTSLDIEKASEIIFTFEGENASPDSDVLGSLIFTDYEFETEDSTIAIYAEKLKFASDDGIHSLLSRLTFPVYGETAGIVSAKRGISINNGVLIVGTD